MTINRQHDPCHALNILRIYNRGGALPLEGGIGMCRGHDPLFSGQLALPSLPICHQCAAHVPHLQF